jgi:hypothetical protein
MSIRIELPKDRYGLMTKVFAVDDSNGVEVEITGVSSVNISITPNEYVKANIEVLDIYANLDEIKGIVEVKHTDSNIV